MDDTRYCLDRHAELKALRAIEEPHWREIAMLFDPDSRDFDAHVQRRRDDSMIFDATPLYIIDDFAGGLFSQMTNPMNHWFSLGIEDPDLKKWGPVKNWLFATAARLYATFTDAVSPFYSEVPAWFGNLGMFGLGAMYSEEMPGKARIVDRAIPIGESFIDIDAQGYVDTFHREFSLTGRQVRKKWPDNREIARRDEKERIVFVHAVWPNDGYVDGGAGRRGAMFQSAYVSPDALDFYEPGFYYELPYAVPQWKRRSGRAYPTGPGHKARADAAMLQDMERTHIVAGQFAAEPPILAHDRATIVAEDIEPNAVLYGAMNADNGKRTIDYLQRGQDVKLSLQQSEQRRQAIRQAFLFSVLQLLNRPEMTATEFLGFNKEFLQLAAPNLVRIQQGGLSPLIARRYKILLRAGQIPPAPPEIAGHAINVEYVSPLAKLLKVSEAQGTQQWLGAIVPIIQAKPEAADKINSDRVIEILADGYVTDPGVINGDDVVAKIRAARAQQQQQMAGVETAERVANIGATVAHANQAQTLSQQRRAK